MKTTNVFYGMVNEITVSRWTKTANGMSINREKNQTIHRIDGECRIYCSDVKLNPFTKEPLLDKDDNPKAGMRTFVIECPLRNIYDWIDTLIKSATADNADIKTVKQGSNSEVYRINVANVVKDAIERVISVSEITEAFEDEYLAIEYDKTTQKIKASKNNAGFTMRSHNMRVFASADLGITEEQAINHWHGNWATVEEIVDRNAKIASRVGTPSATLNKETDSNAE